MAQPPPNFWATPGMMSRRVKSLLDTWVPDPDPGQSPRLASLAPVRDQERAEAQGAVTASGAARWVLPGSLRRTKGGVIL